MDGPEVLTDARFSDADNRRRNREALDAALASLIRERDALDLMVQLQDAGVPAGLAAGVDQLWDNPQLRQRGFFQTYLDQGSAGTERELPTIPWHFDGQVEADITGQPIRGQHNSYVFDELLGLPAPEVETLLEEQVIY